MIEVKILTKKNWFDYSERLQKLESIAEYPYGTDFFRIDHGDSYFNFFERLGETQFHIALHGENVVACSAAVLRKIPRGEGMLSSWYLCDLKVHPDYRHQRIPVALFKKRLFLHYLKCPRAYAISMNPESGPNRVVDIIKKFPYFPIGVARELHIYGLQYEEMKKIEEKLFSVLGPVSYLSLLGKKDLVMKSSGAPMKLIHIQHGPMASSQISAPQEGFTHMICAPKDSKLDKVLKAHSEVAATATVLAHRMAGVDWSFILTSDI